MIIENHLTMLNSYVFDKTQLETFKKPIIEKMWGNRLLNHYRYWLRFKIVRFNCGQLKWKQIGDRNW